MANLARPLIIGPQATGDIDNPRLPTLEPRTAMASNTSSTRVKRKNKHEKAGRRRKNKLAKKSTASAVELFAALGSPGKPAPRA